jgi:cobalt-precorrin-5B (C1)-methyltransferase
MRVRKRALRTGWTTGTCSAAAAKAASTALRDGSTPPTVDTPLPTGNRVTLPVEAYEVGPEAVSAVVSRTPATTPT